MINIGIVIASVREERNGKAVADWTFDYAKSRKDENVTYELVDLKDYPLPLLGTTPTAEQAKTIEAWSKKMAEFDGYVFVTAEYNRVVPGAFKNALDYLQPELHNKAVGYVAYGGLGGLSAIQTLRIANAEQELASVRKTVNFSLMTDFENFTTFKPAPYHIDNAIALFDQLIAWSTALKTIRG